MNYYPFHLGDYAAHTGHLEPLEDLAYRRMLDAYYLREAQLPADPTEVARLIRMRQNMAEVEAVLREFFRLTDDGWFHARCDEEINRMQDKQAKARASAAASVNARRAKAQPTPNDGTANAERTFNDRSADVELPTPTPTPTPTPVNTNTGASAKRGKPAVVMPEGVTESVWADFLTIRKAKRAPLTQTALEGIQREASKAGMSLQQALQTCCARGWQGFKADWVANAKPTVAMPQAMSFAERDELARRKRWEEMTGRKWPTEGESFAGETIDATTLEIGHESADQSN